MGLIIIGLQGFTKNCSPLFFKVNSSRFLTVMCVCAVCSRYY
jgi:hypothetical protein